MDKQRRDELRAACDRAERPLTRVEEIGLLPAPDQHIAVYFAELRELLDRDEERDQLRGLVNTIRLACEYRQNVSQFCRDMLALIRDPKAYHERMALLLKSDPLPPMPQGESHADNG